MTLRFSKKEIIILVGTVVLAALFILGGYFLYLSPKKTEISTKEAQLKSEQQLLTAIQGQLSETTVPSVENISELQKKVPVKQQLEQLILDLEKAEVVSGSFISNMAFSEGDVAAPTQENTATQEQTTEQANQETNNQQQTDNQAETNNQQQTTDQAQTNTNTEEAEPAATPLPAGIKKLTVTLSVKSPTYYDLIKFIETLESLNRLVVVETVAFSGGKELTNLEEEQEELSYSLTFSAFYMPTLEDLQNQLPELETPAPSNKTNPFSSAPELPTETETE